MEENRNDDRDMMSEETSEETTFGGMSSETCQYNDNFGQPKKSGKGLLIGLLLVVVLIGAIAPFAWAMFKKSCLRKNPNLYVLDSLNHTDYTKGRVYETSVKLGAGFEALIREQTAYSPVEVHPGDIIRFIEGFKLRFDISKTDYKAKGENPITSIRYGILYNDKDVVDAVIRVGEKGMQFEIVGKKILFNIDLNTGDYENQKKLVDELKNDKEVQEILKKLFSKTELKETDVVDSKTGETCDVLKVVVSLEDIYEAAKELINIMDTNEAVKAFINSVIDQMADMSEKSGEYDREQIAAVKGLLQSGMFTNLLKESIRSSDAQIKRMMGQYGMRIESDLYVNNDGVMRSDLSFVVDEINTMFFSFPSLSVSVNSYREDIPNEGKMSEDSADLVLEEPYDDIVYEAQEILMTMQSDIIDRILSSPGFADIKVFLVKFMNVDELIEMMRMNQ